MSSTVLERCRGRLSNHVFVEPTELADATMAGLGLSMDVIFHLTEDTVFEDYMRALFILSAECLVIYSSDCDARSPCQVSTGFKLRPLRASGVDAARPGAEYLSV